MGPGERDERRRRTRAPRLTVALGTALLGVGLVQLVKVLDAGRLSAYAGALVLLVVGTALLAYGLRRRTTGASSPTRGSSTAGRAAGPATERDAVTAEEVLEQVRVEVLPGFTPRAEVVERVSDYFEGCAGPTGPDEVAPLVEVVWSQRLAEESTWAGDGDYVRVRAAFDELESSGFVARMDFACCQTCGHAEIDDERRGDEHSYVFFHAQDTERLAEDDTALFLAFGCFDTHPMIAPHLHHDGEAGGADERREHAVAARVLAETEAGVRITDSLQRQGLTVAWDRSPASRPRVEIGSWRKPLPRRPDEGTASVDAARTP